MHHPGDGLDAALSLAVTYPIGMVGVIIALMLVKGYLHENPKNTVKRDPDEAYIASFEISNPAIFGKTIIECAKLADKHFIVSRIWRKDRVILATGQTPLEEGDRVLVITQPKYVETLTILFGKVDEKDWNKSDIDWNTLDTTLVSERILITRSHINGKHLGQLHLRNRFGVNVSRVKRGDIQLMAEPNLVLRVGDRVTVVGSPESCKKVAEELGNTIQCPRRTEYGDYLHWYGLRLSFRLSSHCHPRYVLIAAPRPCWRPCCDGHSDWCFWSALPHGGLCDQLCQLAHSFSGIEYLSGLSGA